MNTEWVVEQNQYLMDVRTIHLSTLGGDFSVINLTEISYEQTRTLYRTA